MIPGDLVEMNHSAPEAKRLTPEKFQPIIYLEWSWESTGIMGGSSYHKPIWSNKKMPSQPSALLTVDDSSKILEPFVDLALQILPFSNQESISFTTKHTRLAVMFMYCLFWYSCWLALFGIFSEKIDIQNATEKTWLWSQTALILKLIADVCRPKARSSKTNCLASSGCCLRMQGNYTPASCIYGCNVKISSGCYSPSDNRWSIFIILYPYYHAVPYYMVQHDRDKHKFSTTPSNGSTGSTKSGMQLSRPWVKYCLHQDVEHDHNEE